ncbi:hypothetical protein F4818DRAFT_450908 [Hypoxylon cercidicola]|nr:hypothetical protein F4818DRAFT_450908 [Hypoxylon cercidicola]
MIPTYDLPDCLIAVSLISMLTAMTACFVRFLIVPTRRSPVAFIDDVTIGLAAVFGMGGVLFAICEAEWHKEPEAFQKFYYLGQALLILGTVLSRVSMCLSAWTFAPGPSLWMGVLAIQMALGLLDAAISYAALVQCSAPWEEPLVFFALSECWSHGLPAALHTMQNYLDFLNVMFMLTAVFAIHSTPRYPISRPVISHPVEWAFAIIGLDIIIILFTTLRRMIIRESMRIDAEPSHELTFTTLFVAEQNLSIVAANILPIMSSLTTTRRFTDVSHPSASPEDVDDTPIPLQNLPRAHSNGNRASTWDSGGGTVTAT